MVPSGRSAQVRDKPAANHAPIAASQVPPEEAPLHAPAWQVSFCVQGLRSSQLAPSDLAGYEHCPLMGLQVPA